jgi:hypothetical protein
MHNKNILQLKLKNKERKNNNKMLIKEQKKVEMRIIEEFVMN